MAPTGKRDHGEITDPNGLVAAARSLEQELENHQRLVRALLKSPLDSEKGIARAAELVRESADAQTNIGALVQALLAAIKLAHDRNVAAVDEANAFVARIDARGQALEALLARFSELGHEAREINGLTTELRAEGGDLRSKEDLLARVLARMAVVRDDARALSTTAHDQEFPEVSRQADAMAQQLGSLHNKLSLLAGKLG